MLYSCLENKLHTPIVYSQGFGAGNFKALFESIELDQMARGNLFYDSITENGSGKLVN